MALTDKDIVITPNRGQSADPKVEFKGASSTLGPQTISLNVYPTSNGTLSFEGSAGQLFSITNTLTGTIYSVNDVSGIPSIEVLDTGVVKLAQYSGNVLVGTATDTGYKLRVAGNINVATNSFIDFGPNATWSSTLRVGGNGHGGSGRASVVTTDGNLHLDGGGSGTGLYLNYYVNGPIYATSSAHVVIHAGNYGSYALPLSGGTMTGIITTVSGGTAINFSGQSDSFGYNATSGLGTYIKGTGSTYVYGGGSFFDGGAQRAILHAGNYTSYSPPYSGGTLTGTWYFQSNLGTTSGATSGPPLQVFATGGNSAFMSFHRSGNYAVNFGLDNDNVLRIGGWSAPANRWELDMSGNNIIPGRLTANAWTTSARNYSNEWIEFPNYSGLYSPLNGAHFYPNNASYGSWRIDGSRNGWRGIYFDSGSTLMMNSAEVGFYRQDYGWQMRWYEGTGYISKGNPGGGTEATILDSSNYTNYTNGIFLRAAGNNDAMNFNTTQYNTMYYAYIANSSNKPPGYSYSYGTIITFDPGVGAGGRAQFYVSHAGNDLIFRGGWNANDSWQTWNRVLTDQNYTSWAPSLTGSGASGTWGINITGTAGSAPANGGTATALNSGNYIARTGSSGNLNTDFNNTPAGTQRYQGDDSSLANSPGGTWWIYEHKRHSNGSNYWGTQVAWGWEDNANRLAQRNVTGNSWSGWVYYLNSGNYNSYSPTLTGGGASGTWGISITGSAASAASVPASGITGQTGMWTSAQRPGPYRLYRRDDNSDYSVQTYWTGARWRLYGYNGDTGHADTHVGYADSAGSSGSSGDANYLITGDNRIIAPSEDTALRMRFGFTSWNNNNDSPYADYLHMRSYSDSSGGSDNLVMFLKNGFGMRIWQQVFGSGSAYSDYRDVLTSGNYNSYAPTLTGGGASGTWGINISGSLTSSAPQLAAATESNSIYVSAPNYTTGSPVKLLNFDWYGNTWAIGNIRSGSSPSDGFGVYFQGSERGRWSSSGYGFQVGTALGYDNPGGWGANIVAAGTYHARLRLKATSYNSSGDRETYLWLDNTVSPATGMYSSAPTFNFNGSISTVQVAGNTVLHAGNYNSYSPTLTGGNASGTWSINITGSAATATDSTKVPLTGGTMTGTLFINSKLRVNNASGPSDSTYGTAADIPMHMSGNTRTQTTFLIENTVNSSIEYPVIVIRRTPTPVGSRFGGMIRFADKNSSGTEISSQIYSFNRLTSQDLFLDAGSGTEDRVVLRAGSSSSMQVAENFIMNVKAAIYAVTTPAALDIDCKQSNYFTKTINGDSTFTFSNVPAPAGFTIAYSFTLELTHTSGTVTWPASVRWPGNVLPSLTTGKTHLFMFVTDDGGSRWRGSFLSNYDN